MQITLRGAVLSKYKSVSAFSKTLGWDRNRAGDIINGRKRPTAEEMEAIADYLNVKDRETFMALFFPALSTL